MAVRCGLLFGNTMAALGNYNDAAICHARTASFSDPILSAMLLEQVKTLHLHFSLHFTANNACSAI